MFLPWIILVPAEGGVNKLFPRVFNLRNIVLTSRHPAEERDWGILKEPFEMQRMFLFLGKYKRTFKNDKVFPVFNNIGYEYFVQFDSLTNMNDNGQKK